MSGPNDAAILPPARPGATFGKETPAAPSFSQPVLKVTQQRARKSRSAADPVIFI
jgi:hypothetical protein